MSSRSRAAAFVVALACVAAASARDVDAHGGQYRAPGGGLPPGIPPPTTAPGGGWWDANLDALVAQDPSSGPVTTGDAIDAARVRRTVGDSRIVPFLRSVVAGAQGPDPDLIAAATLALAKTTREPDDVERILALSGDPARSTMILEAAALAPGLLRRSDPAARFDARLLDKVRGRLLEIYDGVTHAQRRTRCMAALALGLLGDQPQPPADGGDASRGAAARTEIPSALWSRLKESNDLEEQVALVVALGLQARSAVRPETLDGLRKLAADGTLPPHSRPDAVQAQAILSLARIAGAESSGVLLAFVRAPKTQLDLRCAAIASLGSIAARLDPVSRAAAAAEVAAHADRGHPQTVASALLALGRLLAAAMADPGDRLSMGSPAASLLVQQIDEGPGSARRVAALATGFVLRPEPTSPDEPRTSFRTRALDVLAATADDERTDPEVRGVAMLALGLARDRASFGRFGRLLGRKDVDINLRARAAVALGLVGDTSPAPLESLRSALAPQSPDAVRREAARALGRLGDAAALAALLEELRADLPDSLRSRTAVALGALRRPAAADALIALASDRTANDLARAIAVAALGLLADPEKVRSLSLLSTDLSGPALSDALNQALSLL